MTTQAASLQSASADYQSALANYNITASNISDNSALRTAQASVDQAQISVSQAQDNLAKADLVSPINGTVSTVNYNVGDTPSGTAVVVADLSQIQVKVTVAEIDISKIKVGQTAQMTMDALPGKTYTATVASIAPVGTVTQGVVNYAVTVKLIDSDGDVLPGMTANLAIEVDRRTNVLLAPLRAIKTQGNQKVATVLYKGQQISTPVTTGLSNDTQVEVTSGLQEGDEVVIGTTTTTQRNGGGGGVIFGGFGRPPGD
jgi:RND family efflux transporter MFP subunit